METQEKKKLDWQGTFKNKFGDWEHYFEPLFRDGEIMEDLYRELKKQKAQGVNICPEPKNTFRTFVATSCKNLKCIFVLLDPYSSVKQGRIVADGVAMSCENTEGLEEIQPSLYKFYQAIEKSESSGLNLAMHFPHSLQYLCNQGVMFFNTALTVPVGKTGAHTALWEPFMKYFYEEIMSKFTGIIYVLCGKDSQKMRKWIMPLSNHIINLEHPSAAARRYGDWEYNNVFKNINYILKNNNGPESVIKWALEEYSNPDDLPF